MKKLGRILFFLVLVGLAVGMWLTKEGEFLNPLSLNRQGKDKKKELVTFGFLPTWMVGKTRVYGREVSHLIFLGVETEETGKLIWDFQSNKINNESYLRQKEETKNQGGKNILGIKLFKDDKLTKLLSSENYRKNLVEEVGRVVEEEEFDGVNVDFEYQGNPTKILEKNFLTFLEELRQAEVGEISVDVFANTVIKGSATEIEELVSKVDYLVVMAYDFHRPGVDYAGSVAPLGSKVGERNITEVVERYLNLQLNKDKLVLAYPLYGYEWKTYTDEFESQIKRGWYQMASWNRVKNLIKEKKIEVNWDELSMTPWLSFEEDGETRQIYFENNQSLRAKIDLVRQNKLAGYGFWALGYEGEDRSIWGY
ncbi:MAG TPA: glycosyl hydrolase family 18 protein [Candidatus Woesebacteria bacterium]|jgi:spore germination protein YaaH|nr:glycosyl hydrolase family 18 protein [Candidatus Woesebacteria bacterium]HOG37672.1 glycosyl hydrolase family 18 protein [Candidatus Woesebacteria bacterium]